MHVVLSIQRWMELRPAMRDLIGTRLELRLGDPSGSDFDRRVANDVPASSPGRGLIAEKLHFLSALPRIDATPTIDDLSDGVGPLVDRVKRNWNGRKRRRCGCCLGICPTPSCRRCVRWAASSRSAWTVDPTADEVPTWRGPHLFLLIDDYDLVVSSQGNPMPALVQFLPQARDIGLHMVLSRSAGGVGQGMYEPMLRGLREMGTPGVLLSGSKHEGAVLASVKMEKLPPGRGRLVHRRFGSKLIQTAHVTAES